MEIPETAQDLLSFDKKAFAVLARLMPDGSPQATPVWFDVEDGDFRVNTAHGRVKHINMRERSTVAFTVLDPDHPSRYLQVRGKVVGQEEESTRAHLDHLALKHQGHERYPNSTEGQTRVIYTNRACSSLTNR